MINSSLTLDEAFRIHKKQLDHLDAALAKIKEFPLSQYLHVGFDSGLAKATTFVYNLEYCLPYSLRDTRFYGYTKDPKDRIEVPTSWAKEHLICKHPTVTLDFKLTYSSDKDQWSIKCSHVYASTCCKDKYLGYSVNVNHDYSVATEANRVIGWGSNSRNKTAVSRKSDDIGFYIKLFQQLLPFLMDDNLMGVRSILSDAANTKALNSLK